MTTLEDFKKLDLRIGKIIEVEELANPAYAAHKVTTQQGVYGVPTS